MKVLILLMTVMLETAMAMAGGEPSVIAPSYIINANNLSVVYQVQHADIKPQHKKFIQVKIKSVINPSKISLSFNVYRLPITGKKSFVGTFSLFPSDNPGNFIVATQGKFKIDDQVEVALDVIDAIDKNINLQITIDSISMIDRFHE